MALAAVALIVAAFAVGGVVAAPPGCPATYPGYEVPVEVNGAATSAASIGNCLAQQGAELAVGYTVVANSNAYCCVKKGVYAAGTCSSCSGPVPPATFLTLGDSCYTNCYDAGASSDLCLASPALSIYAFPASGSIPASTFNNDATRDTLLFDYTDLAANPYPMFAAYALDTDSDNVADVFCTGKGSSSFPSSPCTFPCGSVSAASGYLLAGSACFYDCYQVAP